MKNSKKQSTSEKADFSTNVIQFSSITKAKNGSYVIRIGRNILFIHPNLLKAIDQQSTKKAS